MPIISQAKCYEDKDVVKDGRATTDFNEVQVPFKTFSPVYKTACQQATRRCHCSLIFFSSFF